MSLYKRGITALSSLLGLIAVVFSCITPFQPDTLSIPSSLVVEGQITNQPGPYIIKLSNTADYSFKSLNLVESGATVSIADNLGNQEVLKESPIGTYQTAASGIQGVVGRRYKLTIQTKAGKRYESDTELLSAAPPILNTYSESVYTPATGTTASKQIWNVYLDTKDPDTLGNYYKWNWTHYEFTDVCQKTYVSRINSYTGISCCTDCWNITRCYNCININSDQNINGKAISRQPIAEVPFTSLSRYYIEIEQQALSRGTYVFWKSVKQLTSNTGGLFDAAPSSVQGNLRCTSNASEVVYGYFGAMGVSVTYLYVDRSSGKGNPLVDLPVNVPYPTNPPCITCENSLYQTPTKPRWWTY
ncbi:DUF4249 domain-containing protein [Spirosoma litoris]